MQPQLSRLNQSSQNFRNPRNLSLNRNLDIILSPATFQKFMYTTNISLALTTRN